MGSWEGEDGENLSYIGPGSKRAYGPFGRSRGQTGQISMSMEDDILLSALLDDDHLYYVCHESQSVLRHRCRQADGSSWVEMKPLEFSNDICGIKPASGYLFVLLVEPYDLYKIGGHEGDDDMEFVTQLPYSLDDLFSTYTDKQFVNFMVEHADDEDDEIFLDAIVHDNRVTYVLFTKGDRHLCVWRPDMGVFQARVPNICICRFVPGTNGTVVAGVFGSDRAPRGFNIFNIYDGKVPGESLSVERGRVVSLVIMHDWRVSLVTYNDFAPRGSRGVAKIFQLTHSKGFVYDRGFNSHLNHYDDYEGCYNEGYDSDGERELLGLNDRSSDDGYDDFYDDDFYDDDW